MENIAILTDEEKALRDGMISDYNLILQNEKSIRETKIEMNKRKQELERIKERVLQYLAACKSPFISMEQAGDNMTNAINTKFPRPRISPPYKPHQIRPYE